MFSVHTVEMLLTAGGIGALVWWWESVCRVGCADRFHHFYMGVPLVLVSYGWHSMLSCALQFAGVFIMSDAAYVAWRQSRQTNKEHKTTPYQTPFARWLANHRTPTHLSCIL